MVSPMGEITVPHGISRDDMDSNRYYSAAAKPNRPNSTGKNIIFGRIKLLDADGDELGDPAVGRKSRQRVFIEYLFEGPKKFETTMDELGHFSYVLPSGVTAVRIRTDRTIWKKYTSLTNLRAGQDVPLHYGRVRPMTSTGDNNIDATIGGADRAYIGLRLMGKIDITSIYGNPDSDIYAYDFACDLNGDGSVAPADRDFLILTLTGSSLFVDGSGDQW